MKPLTAVRTSVPMPVSVRPPPPTRRRRGHGVAWVSNVPPPALSVTARVEVSAALNCKVPPLKLGVALAAPRLSSAEIASVPPFSAQFVVSAVVPLSVQVPVPVFWRDAEVLVLPRPTRSARR